MEKDRLLCRLKKQAGILIFLKSSILLKKHKKANQKLGEQSPSFYFSLTNDLDFNAQEDANQITNPEAESRDTEA